MAGHVNKKDWKKQLQQKKDFPYSFEELLGYYGAMYSAYKNVLATKPDAIIAPLRGAFPLVKTLQFFASIEGKTSAMPKVYYPRTGELTAPTKKRSFDKLIPNYAPSMAIGRRKKELRLALELAIVGSKKKASKSCFA